MVVDLDSQDQTILPDKLQQEDKQSRCWGFRETVQDAAVEHYEQTASITQKR